MMRVLQLTSYPTSRPVHGGQIRCANIAAELRNAGHEVKSLSVFPAPYYDADSSDDIAFQENSEYWNNDLLFLTDYFSGVFAAEDVAAFKRLSDIVDNFSPDVVVVEQVWLMKAVMLLRKSRDFRIVYSSHNVEFRLKISVCRTSNLESDSVSAISNDIFSLERDAVAGADLVITCTEADAECYREMVLGSRVVVGGNGVSPFSCRSARVDQWRHFAARPYPIFVSSAHLPNATGFWDMMSPGLTFLRPGERMYIAGSVSDIIFNVEHQKQFENFNRARIELLGRMEQAELQAAIRASHVVLLPITSGEGSNLKTAEALESGCAIVGTSKAFRGFERAMCLPHVQIVDEPSEFRRRVRVLLDQPRYEGGTPLEVRSAFYWSSLLQEAVHAINSLH